jgi:hypothetical protein
MVRWLRAIEFVEDYSHIGDGHGGWPEDPRLPPIRGDLTAARRGTRDRARIEEIRAWIGARRVARQRRRLVWAGSVHRAVAPSQATVTSASAHTTPAVRALRRSGVTGN